jgi:hypothetical protein
MLSETELGSFPKTWQVNTLQDYVTRAQYGLSLKGNGAGSCPILRMTNQVNGRISLEKLQYVDVNMKDLPKFKLDRGDLLFNRTNSFDLVGRTAIFDLPGDFVFASYLIRIRTDTSRLDPFFLNLYLNASSTQRRLKSIATRAVSQSNISATRLQTFRIPVPPLTEQRKIATILSFVQRALEQQDRLFALTIELKRRYYKNSSLKDFTANLRSKLKLVLCRKAGLLSNSETYSKPSSARCCRNVLVRDARPSHIYEIKMFSGGRSTFLTSSTWTLTSVKQLSSDYSVATFSSAKAESLDARRYGTATYLSAITKRRYTDYGREMGA